MFRNYLIVAIRNLVRHKVYSFINIFGLAIGIAACLLISFYVKDELNYDAYHEDSDRIFRVAFEQKDRTGSPVFATAPGPLAPALKEEFPQVERAVRFVGGPDLVVQYGEDTVFHEHGEHFYVDPEFFEVFTIPFLRGNPETALAHPQSVVISEDIARKYFATEEPLGKYLHFEETDWKVTGVYESIPHNTHLPKFGFLSSIKPREDPWYKDWLGLRVATYVKLKMHTNVEEFEDQIRHLAHKHAGEQLQAEGATHTYFLQPITDIHLHSHLIQESGSPGNVKEIAIFSLIALFVLCLACLTYINLATARSVIRSKEVSVRKVVGANRMQLVNQFLGESIVLNAIALAVAFALVEVVLPWFNAMSDKALRISYVSDLSVFLSAIVIMLFVGVLGGSYPAFFLSSFQPSAALRGPFNRGRRNAGVRSALVTFQFAVSSTLIVGTLVVYQQIYFMKSQDLGFEKEQMLVLPIQGREMMKRVSKNLEAIKESLTSHHSVVSATATLRTPGRMTFQDGGDPGNRDHAAGFMSL